MFLEPHGWPGESTSNCFLFHRPSSSSPPAVFQIRGNTRREATPLEAQKIRGNTRRETTPREAGKLEETRYEITRWCHAQRGELMTVEETRLRMALRKAREIKETQDTGQQRKCKEINKNSLQNILVNLECRPLSCVFLRMPSALLCFLFPCFL